MVVSAARLGPRLAAELARADDGSRPIAEVWRRVGAAADRLEVPRPSYERIRMLVNERRSVQRRPSTLEVAIDVAYGVRPADALPKRLVGMELPP